MVLLLSMNEADCLDQQHRRSSGTTNRHLTGRSAYRASGLVLRLEAVTQFRRLKYSIRRYRPLAEAQ